MENSSIINLKYTDSINLAQFEELFDKVKNKKYGDIIWSDDLPVDEKSKSFVKNIQDRIIQNNETFTRFPNDYLHSLFSYYAYKDLSGGQKLNEIPNWNNIKMDELSNWQVHEVYNKPSKDEQTLKKGSIYSGALFINHTNNQMVLAHRGIDEKLPLEYQTSLSTNLNDILFNNTLQQMAFCYEVTEHVIKNIANKNEFKDYYLSFTGYSNGAWLAEYSIYFAHEILDYFETKAVLFESPGIIKHQVSLNSNIVSEDTEEAFKNLNVVNYLTSPNLLNTSNSHIGTVYRIFLDNQENDLQKILDFVEKSLKPLKIFDSVLEKIKQSKFLINGLMSMLNQEKLEAIISLFNKETGKPEYFEQILNWPDLKIDFGNDFKDNFKNLFKDKPVEKILENIKLAKSHSDLFTNASKSILTTGCGLILDNLTKLASPSVHFLINAIIEISSKNIELNKFENESFYKKIDEIKMNENFMEYNYMSNEDENKREEKKENLLKEIKAKIYMSKKTEPKTNDLLAANSENKIFLTTDYSPSRVINKVKILKPLADKHNIDWCLKNLYFNFRQITRFQPSKLIFEQLKSLISKYSIKTEVIRSIKLDPVHFLFIDDEELTVELLKDKLIRLLKIYPEIKNLIESLNQTNLPNEMNDKSLVRNSFILDKNYNYVKKIDFDDILNKFMVQKKRSILIHGIAGSGKSTSASEFSRYFCKKNLHKHFCLSLEMRKINNQVIEQIIEYRKKINKNNTYLFVFDNINFDDSFEEKYETIIKDLPSNVLILLTSVSSNEKFLKKFDFCIEMELFNGDEARNYFKLALKNKNGDIESIMNKLSEKNFIPLKLLNIISCLNDSESLSIEEAMQTIKFDNFDLSNFLFGELLKEESTKTILELLAFTHSKKLSIYFMKKMLCYEFLTVKRFNDGKINQGVFKLKNFSILYQVNDSNDNTNYLNIHDALKDELLKIMAKDETKMNEKLNKILKNIKKNLDSNTIFTLNDYSHILNIMSHANTDSAEYYNIFNKLKIFFRKSSENFFKEQNYNEAIQYLHKYNELIELQKDNIDEYELFFVYDNLEKCYSQLNETDQASKYHKLLDDLSITRDNYESRNGNFDSIEDDPEILEMLRINSKQENELFANTLYNIASSYQAIGKYKDAIKLYEISIEIYLLIYGEKDNIFVDLVYECIKECDIDGSHMKDVRENSTNPLNSKFLSYKEKNQSKACIIS